MHWYHLLSSDKYFCKYDLSRPLVSVHTAFWKWEPGVWGCLLCIQWYLGSRRCWVHILCTREKLTVDAKGVNIKTLYHDIFYRVSWTCQCVSLKTFYLGGCVLSVVKNLKCSLKHSIFPRLVNGPNYYLHSHS